MPLSLSPMLSIVVPGGGPVSSGPRTTSCVNVLVPLTATGPAWPSAYSGPFGAECAVTL